MLFRRASKAHSVPPVPKVPAKPAAETREHQVGGRVLPLVLTRNPRAKRLTLRIERGGQGLRVTAPPDLATREIDRFLLRQREWLEERLARLPDRPVLKAGIKLPLRGVPHRIVQAGGRTGVSIGRDDAGPVLLVGGGEEFVARRLADFLKREAKRDIPALVARHAAAVGRRPTAIRFRDTASRWGSCTAAGALSFSWRIMMAPPPVIDYLAAHEVAHLKEMNHGPAFWALCEKLCPDTKRCREWLKRNGGALQAIPFG
jgi:predicted metal-dependent hydrolase